MQTRLTINGVSQTRDVAPATLLVELLRDDLGLTGTHIGCDTSQCGACNVLIDGKAVKSCTILAVQADGAAITTIDNDKRQYLLSGLQNLTIAYNKKKHKKCLAFEATKK